MLQIQTLPLGAYQTNTYIVHKADSQDCVIIDPGYAPQTILDKLTQRNLRPAAILLTHGHFDHVGAVEALVDATGCQLWMAEDDWSQPHSPIHRYFYPLANRELPGLQFCREDDPICVAGLTFRVYATPGHTPGSVCLRCEDALFSGDTLFAGSCGRTDLPGGSWPTLEESLARLALLEDDLRVFPGHGEASTLSHEKKSNPYLRG
jgi:glyoxylase-like metal-dependent hydrolase (beta-lactamase superfamily II)